MKVKTGLKGIRKFLKDDNAGWHVHVNNKHYGYEYGTVSQIFLHLEIVMGEGCTFTGWMGNALFFTAEPD